MNENTDEKTLIWQGIATGMNKKDRKLFWQRISAHKDNTWDVILNNPGTPWRLNWIHGFSSVHVVNPNFMHAIENDLRYHFHQGELVEITCVGRDHKLYQQIAKRKLGRYKSQLEFRKSLTEYEQNTLVEAMRKFLE